MLVCGEDGIVSLDAAELGQVLDTDFEDVEWVRG